jgi:hypothetical protein
MAEWQPIETAPRDETEILLYCPKHYFGGGVYVGWWRGGGDGYWVAPGQYMDWNDSNVGAYSTSATHWMPLPNPPSPQEENGNE